MKYLSRIALCVLSIPVLASAPENPGKKIDFIKMMNKVLQHSPIAEDSLPAYIREVRDGIEDKTSQTYRNFQLQCIFTQGIRVKKDFLLSVERFLGREIFQSSSCTIFTLHNLDMLAEHCHALDKATMQELLNRVETNEKGAALTKYQSEHLRPLKASDFKDFNRGWTMNYENNQCESCQLLKEYIEKQKSIIREKMKAFFQKEFEAFYKDEFL